jgi:hypothetical protein
MVLLISTNTISSRLEAAKAFKITWRVFQGLSDEKLSFGSSDVRTVY